VLLREVFEHKNREAARAIGLSESTFRHRLASGRDKMRRAFEDLCALIGKRGVCYQCSTLRDALPTESQGAPVTPLAGAGDSEEQRFARRLAVVKSHDFTAGSNQPLNDWLMETMRAMFDGASS
jgi:hypothetical protein